MKERENPIVAGGLNDKRLLDVSEVCYYLGLGRNRGVEFARSIGAERKVYYMDRDGFMLLGMGLLAGKPWNGKSNT